MNVRGPVSKEESSTRYVRRTTKVEKRDCDLRPPRTPTQAPGEEKKHLSR